MANNFWTNAGAANDPKRGFRFRVMIPGIDSNYLWYAKTATKPQISFGEASHSYLNHTYYWPGRAEWNEVDVVLVDPVEPNLGGNMSALITAAGYAIPEDSNSFSTMSKARASQPLGVVTIEQIDESGNTIEKWNLNNAWVKELSWGDLDYSSDDLTECTIKFRYDWASLTSKADGPQNISGPFFAGPTTS
mgnify:FL=1|jgi:hypothetical protein|tara:strand:- start:2941 stop:3513 length:573 start_codon:yes stop_codon:yes gene_type:complete